MQRQEARQALFQEAFRSMPRWEEAPARMQKLGKDIRGQFGEVTGQETVMLRITRQRRREMAKVLAKRSLAGT